MASATPKILVADDDPGIVDALTLLLEEFSYTVSSTSDGTTLLDLQHNTQDHPDLIILDIWMSGWNGGEICHQLKSSPRTRSIPIILFSANKDIASIAHQAGADDFIAKPFDLDNLLDKIDRLL